MALTKVVLESITKKKLTDQKLNMIVILGDYSAT